MQMKRGLELATCLLFLVVMPCCADVFKVSDYGAVPNTGVDQLTHLTTALTAAGKANNSVLLFNLVGQYRLSGYILSLQRTKSEKRKRMT
jgi:hypothetical protein